MSKKTDSTMTNKDDAEELPPKLEPAPARVSSSDVPASVPAPRAARFGEGAEGKGLRHERGVRGSRANFFTRAGDFLSDVRSEMKRVSWPTANEVKNTTIITLIAVVFFAAYLYGIDHLWAFVIDMLTRFANWLAGGA